MHRSGLAVFLDRDGVINADRIDFVKSWDEFEFLPTALEALADLARTQYQIVILTNQSGIGRGLLTEATLLEMNARMIEKIQAAGGRIDAIYYCPHVPAAGCSCRKPAPGMFLQASADLNIDLKDSWMVGDQVRDAEAAAAAGVKSILVGADRSNGSLLTSENQSLYAKDLLEAVSLIQAARPGSKLQTK